MKQANLALFFFFVMACLFAQAQDAEQKQQYSLKPYFLVLLKTGPNRTQDSITLAHIQKGHLENINRLAAEGVLNVAGPFIDTGNLRGIFVFDCSTEDSVVTMLNADPSIKAGRLAYEIHPWMTQRGTCFK